MRMEAAREALAQGRRLEVRHDSYALVVAVQACGFTVQGHAVMWVWQVRRGSASGERAGWKILR